MWRLRLFFERIGRKWILIGVAVIVLVVAGAAGAIAFLGGGSDKSSASTSTEVPLARTNLFYLRAMAPTTSVHGCAMTIRYHWKLDYHAIQYLGSDAIITATGAGISGSYRKRLTRKGLTLSVGPVSLAGGYQLWSAKVTSVDGDPPGNDTTVQAAPPPTTKCE
jgi:hypothetical protein